MHASLLSLGVSGHRSSDYCVVDLPSALQGTNPDLQAASVLLPLSV